MQTERVIHPGKLAEGLKSSGWRSGRPVKVIVHGFLETGRRSWIRAMKDRFLQVGDANVISVDWDKLVIKVGFLILSSSAMCPYFRLEGTSGTTSGRPRPPTTSPRKWPTSSAPPEPIRPRFTSSASASGPTLWASQEICSMGRSAGSPAWILLDRASPPAGPASPSLPAALWM